MRNDLHDTDFDKPHYDHTLMASNVIITGLQLKLKFLKMNNLPKI